MSLSVDKQGLLAGRIIKENGGPKTVIDSYNQAVERLIPQIAASMILRHIKSNKVVQIVKIEYSKPRIKKNGDTIVPLYPIDARRDRFSLRAQMRGYFQLFKKEDNEWVKDGEPKVFLMGEIPVMVLSILDNLSSIKNKDDILQLGESDVEFGGYFIINGGEKVVGKTEKLNTERFLLYEGLKDGEYIVKYTATTLIETTVVIVKEKSDDIQVTFSRLNITNNQVNIFYIFFLLNAMGPLSNLKKPESFEMVYELMDQFIIDSDPNKQKQRRRELRYYLSSTEKAFTSTVSEANDIYKKIYGYINDNTSFEEDINIKLRIAQTVVTEIFKNVNMTTDIRSGDVDSKKYKAIADTKARMLAYMVVKYVEFKNGYRKMDNRDAWSSKRVVDPGVRIANRFAHLLKSVIGTLQTDYVSNIATIDLGELVKRFPHEKISKGFIDSFNKDAWNAIKGAKEEVVVDMLKRDTRIASLTHIMKLSAPTNRRAKIRDKRLLDSSAYGNVCPIKTPEGEACGLVKDQTILSCVSHPRSFTEITGIQEKTDYYLNPIDNFTNPFFINGVLIGYCNIDILQKKLVNKRRNIQIPFDTSIFRDEYGILWVYTTSGRVCRPLLIVDDDGKLIIDKLNMWDANLYELMAKGAIEYLDASEQEQTSVIIAETLNKLKEEDIKYTHCEVDPIAMIGISASIIPLPENMTGARSTFQCSMGPQAGGSNSARYDRRFDTTYKTLVMPNIPQFSTNSHDIWDLDKYPATQEAFISISCYQGDNQEDALTINGDALNRGMCDSIIYYSVETTIRSGADERLGVPQDLSEKEKPLYSKLDGNGIIKKGEYVKKGDVLVAKIIQTGNNIQNTSLTVEAKKEGIIDEVYITETNTSKLIRIRIMDYRTLELGDKMASRYSQKGTIGGIYKETELPTIIAPDNPHLHGIRPSIIFNPHGIPSRMTVGKLIEILVGLFASMKCTRINATPFRNFTTEEGDKENNLKYFRNKLKEMGFNESGKVKMLNGITGRVMDSEIFSGIISYQVLKHFVKEKAQARSTGSIQFLTHQPIGGIRTEGGLRLGEMDRDAFIAYGASDVLRERLMFSSDAYFALICAKCGIEANSYLERNEISCPKCQGKDIYQVVMPYSFSLLRKYAAACNSMIALNIKKL